MRAGAAGAGGAGGAGGGGAGRDDELNFHNHIF